MNERIREIAEHAGIKFNPLIVDDIEYDYEDVEMDGWDVLQNFAELIIKECANECYNPDNEIFVTRVPQLYEAHKRIKRHFGVE